MDKLPTSSPVPVILAFGGCDATGGAGLAADIETAASLGCHCAPVATAITVQDTRDVKGYAPVDGELVMEQARAVLEDMPVAAIKLGMVGSEEAAAAIHTVLRDYPDVTVVLDPVLSAGGGGALSSSGLVEALRSLLLPLTTIATPNSVEARALAPGADTLDACAQDLLALGCRHVLITGAHEPESAVVNRFYSRGQPPEQATWERIPHGFHGSGCTLASAIATFLARGRDPGAAVAEAQEYAWRTLRHGYRLGMGQLVPDRFYRARGAGGNR